ncbi:MAG TPA: phosphoglycerate mutase family protein, partial [Oscillospiraceae bacterium]|nr:phosphoglycerate mutase family protein [Oscillospiraceae bacterium]
MITYKLHLIRHGETEGNRKKICVGARTDLPLAPEGAE